MKSAADELRSLLDYDKMSAFRLLEQPKIEKRQIPDFIDCPKFKKAMTKVGQTMERYDGKVASIAADIAMQDRIKREAEIDKPMFVSSDSSPERVHKYNQCVNIINRSIEKRNDLIDRHNDAIAEAREKLEELTQQALLVIDDDVVAVLDRCTKIVDKLAGSQNTEDLVVAVEICLMEMRIFTIFEEKIEGNVARKDCRERIADVNRLFAALCANAQVRNYLSDRFRKNAHLVQRNQEACAQITTTIDAVDQRQLEAHTRRVAESLGLNIRTDFAYDGVVDPARLEAIVVEITNAIAALRHGIADANEVGAATATAAQATQVAQESANQVLVAMRSNVAGLGPETLSRDHVTCQMIDETVIEDFYQRDVRPAVVALRQHLVAAVGEEHIDAIVTAKEDRFALTRAQRSIEQARLGRLQAERQKIEAHVRRLSELIVKCEGDIGRAGEVPRQNAEALRRELGTKYVLSCFPGIGFFFALTILARVKTFEPAFRSANPIYRGLATALLAKTGTMTRVVLVLGVLLGLGGMAAFFALGVGPAPGVNAGVPGAVLGFYLITAAVLAAAGKRLRAYVAISGPAARTSEGEISDQISAAG